jgi:hypothetical protein
MMCRHQMPCLVFHKCVIFFIHCLAPMRCISSLTQVSWFSCRTKKRIANSSISVFFWITNTLLKSRPCCRRGFRRSWSRRSWSCQALLAQTIRAGRGHPARHYRCRCPGGCCRGPSRRLRTSGARGGANLLGARGSPGRRGRAGIVCWRRGRARVARRARDGRRARGARGRLCPRIRWISSGSRARQLQGIIFGIHDGLACLHAMIWSVRTQICTIFFHIFFYFLHRTHSWHG